MAVDMKPEVGRIAMMRGRSTDFFPWFFEGGKITKISGQRVYITKRDGTETFIHEWSAVVDTDAEREALLKFTDEKKAELAEIRKRFDAEAADLMAKISKPLKSISKPAAPIVKRQRR